MDQVAELMEHTVRLRKIAGGECGRVEGDPEHIP